MTGLVDERCHVVVVCVVEQHEEHDQRDDGEHDEQEATEEAFAGSQT